MKKLFALTLLCMVYLKAQQVQKATPYPDCIISPTLTAVGATTPVPQSQNPTACAIWVFAYTTNGIPSGVSIAVQTAADVNGAPGSWSNATPTTGSNPNTATTSAVSIFGSGTAPVSFPWWRVNLTTLTGGGKVSVFLYGWKLSARLGGGGGGGGGGTVTTVACTTPFAPLFNCSVASPTSTPTLSFSQIVQNANLIYGGPASGAAANPTFRALVTNDLPATAVSPATYGDSTHVGQFTVDQKGRLTFAANVAITGGGGSCSDLSPLFTSASCVFSQIAQNANLLFAGPASGGAANPTFRAQVTADLPSTAVTPAAYGDSTHVGQFTVNQKGQLTAAANVALLAGSAGGNYTQNFSSATSVDLTHNFGTTSVVTQCFDGSNGAGNLLIPAAQTNTDTNNTTITFSVAQSGSCVVNASANSGGATIASGAAALGTGAIASGTCATAVTATATGVATTDAIIANFNADPTSTTGYIPSTSGMLVIVAYPTAGAVNFKVCNNTNASVTPSVVTLNWRVVR